MTPGLLPDRPLLEKLGRRTCLSEMLPLEQACARPNGPGRRSTGETPQQADQAA
jgi:hypothetical protein